MHRSGMESIFGSGLGIMQWIFFLSNQKTFFGTPGMNLKEINEQRAVQNFSKQFKNYCYCYEFVATLMPTDETTDETKDETALFSW